MDFADDAPLGAAMQEIRLKRRELHAEKDLTRAREIEGKTRKTMAEHAFVRRIERMKNAPDEIQTWVQVLRVGDLPLVGIPGEYSVALGLDIKKRSLFGQTLILELANDSVGYLPTRRAFEEGGYEPEASHFLPGVGEQIAETALKLLSDVNE